MVEQCREQGQLDQVWFVPSARPPHKQDVPITPFRQRVEMLQLAIAGQADFRVEEIEQERPGPSYTVDTLSGLSRCHPGHTWALLLGTDALVDLPQWYDPSGIVQRAVLLVMPRHGFPFLTAEQLRAALKLPEGTLLQEQLIEVPQIDIASRDLRRRAAAGRSLRYLLPRAVECYIRERHLYRKDTG
jgi:nicotinate-nucleotide adenylyltransferase